MPLIRVSWFFSLLRSSFWNFLSALSSAFYLKREESFYSLLMYSDCVFLASFAKIVLFLFITSNLNLVLFILTSNCSHSQSLWPTHFLFLFIEVTFSHGESHSYIKRSPPPIIAPISSHEGWLLIIMSGSFIKILAEGIVSWGGQNKPPVLPFIQVSFDHLNASYYIICALL